MNYTMMFFNQLAEMGMRQVTFSKPVISGCPQVRMNSPLFWNLTLDQVRIIFGNVKEMKLCKFSIFLCQQGYTVWILITVDNNKNLKRIKKRNAYFCQMLLFNFILNTNHFCSRNEFESRHCCYLWHKRDFIIRQNVVKV